MDWAQWRELADSDWANTALYRVTQSNYTSELIGESPFQGPEPYWVLRLREDAGAENREWVDLLAAHAQGSNLLDILLSLNNLKARRLRKLGELRAQDAAIAQAQERRMAMKKTLASMEKALVQRWDDVEAILHAVPMAEGENRYGGGCAMEEDECFT